MNENLLLKNISEIGLLLLRSGAEIYRVEESLTRMCQTYDFSDIGVFALPSYFTLSVTFPSGQSASITKRTTQNRTNLDKIHELNSLVRYICQNKPDNDYIEKEITRIVVHKENMLLVFLGYGFGASFFSVFFGGGLNEFIVSTLIGFGTYFVVWILEALEVNGLVRTALTSMFLSALSIIFYHFQIIQNLDACIIGCLMVLVPGIAITNSLRDIMDGNYVSGGARFFEAFSIATAIALGVGAMRILMGGMI